MPSQSTPQDLADGNLLRVASLLEAATLAALVLIAVPMKYLANIGVATRIMGPIHGAAFLFYLWALLQMTSIGGWRPVEVLRMFLVACIPLAGFLNQPWLTRKLRALHEHDALA
jgi:integral membrane protein